MFCKESVLKIFAQENTCVENFFFNKVGSGKDVFLWIKRIFKNIFFIEHLWWLLLFKSMNDVIFDHKFSRRESKQNFEIVM